MTEIGLAVNDRRKGPNGDWIEETTFVDVTLWARTAEDRQRIPEQGLAGADRGAAEARHLGKRRQEKLEVASRRRKDAIARRSRGGRGDGGGAIGRGRTSGSGGNQFGRRRQPTAPAPAGDDYESTFAGRLAPQDDIRILIAIQL